MIPAGTSNELDVQNEWEENTHTHTQCEWHRMTRMTGPDCVVMCNLINTHTHTHTHTRKKCRKERVGSVAANSDNLGSNKEAGGGAQGAQGSSKICTNRESVSPLSEVFVTSIIDPPLGGSMRVA